MKRVVLDLDGCLHWYYSGYTGLSPEDPPTPGALDFVHWLREKGFEVVICTARIKPDGTGATEIREWLVKHSFPDDLVVTNTKFPAVLYVDDRGWRFDGNWNDIKFFLEGVNLKPGSWVDNHWRDGKEFKEVI